MDVLDIDIETYSTVELKKANVYAYVEDPEFEVLMCGWSLNGSPVEVYDSHAEFQDRLREVPGLWDPDVRKVAHNAGFERVCLSRYDGRPTGDYLPAREWLDTAALAALHGYPRSLDGWARALGAAPKDSAGTRLINLFSKPYRGRRVMAEERPEQWAEFMSYCGQDVATMQEARLRMGRAWPEDGFERDLWYLDQEINDRGMRVDLALARAAARAALENNARMEEEVRDLTGVDNAGSVPQVRAWLLENGAPLPDLQATTVADWLSRSDLPDAARRVLELRQELALVAHRKFEAALRGASPDGRLRGQFVYHAAHTARWSSRGVQVHNMPRLSFEYRDEDGEKRYDVLAEDIALEALRLGLGGTPETLKKCVRPMFLGPLGQSDFSAIEARVLAWNAGEQWVLDAFSEGRDLYVETAERMGGGMGRPEGKIAVLAAGYQGSVGSFRNMGYGGRRCPRDTAQQIPYKDPRTGKEHRRSPGGLAGEVERMRADRAVPAEVVAELEEVLRRHDRVVEEGRLAELLRDENHKCDDEIRAIVEAWRDANPRIRQFWYDLESAFWRGGEVGRVEVQVRRGVDGNASERWIVLPSGRAMKYRGVHRRRVEVLDDEGRKTGRTKQQLYYRHVNGYGEKTYGGRLTENVTQAIARDLLADAMLRLDAAGFYLVGHVHDEALADADRPGFDLDLYKRIMATPPAWAADMPMDASAAVLERYRKD